MSAEQIMALLTWGGLTAALLIEIVMQISAMRKGA